ncbi:hypothetical protein MRX96_047641 [Rhipicephalus microplus]
MIEFSGDTGLCIVVGRLHYQADSLIWHWNANGFRCRKAILQQYLRSLAPTARPDVIAVQETHTEDTPTLPGYRTHACPPSARTCGKGAAQGVCTFIRKGIAHVKHQQFLGSRDTAIELCVTELAISGKGRGTRGARKKKTSTTVFIANIYSNPRHGKQKFKTLFHKIKRATSQAQKDLAKRGDAAVVICGDFHAQHRELGYTTTTSKARNLLEDAGEAEFTLLINPAHPSRIGTSVARDTNPDLTFAMLPEGGTAKWRNTGINLGSDHFIIEIELPLAHLNGNPNRDKTIKHKLVDWSKFRNTELGEVDNIEEWSAKLLAATEGATKEIDAPEEIETMDPRLAHLLEARRSLQKRWRRQRHNRKLRKKIAELGREIERHSRQLCSQQWDAGRRAARAVALARQHQRDEGAVYVDAARYPGRRNAFAAVVVSATTGKLLTASTVRARTAGQAEEAAIALARARC